MIGIQHLIKMRESGKRPDSVFISFGIPYKPPKYLIEYKNLEVSYKPCNDYRPFIGLDVILVSPEWTKDVATCYEALQGYAKTIAVLIVEFEQDLGFHWDKDGQHDYNIH